MSASFDKGPACAGQGRRAMLLVAVALLVATVLGLVLLLTKVRPSGGAGHSPLFILVPVYTALIPIYIAAWRRRRNKTDA